VAKQRQKVPWRTGAGVLVLLGGIGGLVWWLRRDTPGKFAGRLDEVSAARSAAVLGSGTECAGGAPPRGVWGNPALRSAWLSLATWRQSYQEGLNPDVPPNGKAILEAAVVALKTQGGLTVTCPQATALPRDQDGRQVIATREGEEGEVIRYTSSGGW
jgi:hypothetical protein